MARNSDYSDDFYEEGSRQKQEEASWNEDREHKMTVRPLVNMVEVKTTKNKTYSQAYSDGSKNYHNGGSFIDNPYSGMKKKGYSDTKWRELWNAWQDGWYSWQIC